MFDWDKLRIFHAVAEAGSFTHAAEKLGMSLGIGPRFAALTLLTMLPLVVVLAGLQTLAAAFARSYREAQTYASYIATLVSFVPMIVLFSGLKDAFWQLWVPALGQQMVFTRIMRGEALGAQEWALPALVAFALAAACLHAVARLLRDERIVFGRP